TLHEEMLTVFDQVHAWERELEALAARMSDPALVERAGEYSAVLERYADLQARFEHASGYTIEPRVRQVLDGLGFTHEQQAAPATQLSGGQQTRAALGKLLLQEPDLLLLDEPTNHLDLAALEWLEGYLTSWRGAVIVVSHDRYFLDRVTSRTIELAHQRAEEYPGNYTRYVQLHAERLARWEKEYEAQQEYIARTEEFIRRYKAGQRSKEARGRQTLLDRMERIARPPVEHSLKFKLGAQIQSGQTVLTAEKLEIGYAAGQRIGDTPDTGAELRVRVADTTILRGDRVGLIGPNGGGKTTLLRTIIGRLAPLAGHATLGHNVQVGYYAQTHENLNMRSTVLDEIRRASQLSEEGARSYLGRFLFSGDDVFKPISALSGGERSRVALAKLTLQGANFLVLDEPTNHLDLPARQMLEEILAGYDGTMIFVSHDRYFVDALATKLWMLEDGAITAHVGNYTTYRTRKQQAEFAERVQATRTAAIEKRATQGRAAEQAGAPPPRTVERLEAEIATLEARLAEIEGALAEASARMDVERITELGSEHEETKARLEHLYEEWQELAS
ncbi:MAG TPA: ABC-F family ATP-binding cassette domain-containing protein, partial [Ktedonobacterales bacterium]|nr:ABC-F family ATP-binding cassette domain-containing protein [Ktedonobacterales bacterium]